MSTTHMGSDFKELVTPYSRLTTSIPTEAYQKVRHFIIQTLSKGEDTTFQQLLEFAEHEYQSVFKDKTTWYVLKVKLDMEAKKEIRVRKPQSPVGLPLLKLSANIRG